MNQAQFICLLGVIFFSIKFGINIYKENNGEINAQMQYMFPLGNSIGVILCLIGAFGGCQ